MSDSISRQAVLDQTYLWSKDEFLRVTNPFDYLCKRINSLPSVEPEKPQCSWYGEDGRCHFAEQEMDECDDCISRRAAIDEIIWNEEHGTIGAKEAVECLQRLPSVDPERKPGKWEWDQRTGEYVCSECGCNPIYERTTPDASEIDKYRYCRWCGAPMEVDG